MLRFLKWMLPAVVAIGFVASMAPVVKAADEGATIKGTVVDKDGKAVADAPVRLSKPRAQGQQGGQRPEPLATATTDKDGKFELKIDKSKVADGEYSVSSYNREARTMAREVVTIKDGKPDKTEVTLKLAPMPQRGQGGQGGGNR